MENLNWSALEYEEKERSNDWFWAFGIIIVAGSIASIIFANYFFAILLIIGGILLAFFSIKKPENVSYELNEKAISFIQTYMDKQGAGLRKMKTWAKPYFNLYDVIL